MASERVSGVLVHPTSFPGPHGIGDLGPAAFRFVDWLVLAGQRRWQLMPLGPTGYGDSPYASSSSFAGNPLLISLDWLLGEGLLEPDDLAVDEPFREWEVEFGSVIAFKGERLRRAFARFETGAASDQAHALSAFIEAEATWLDDYALYMAIREANGGTTWQEWDRPLRLREAGAIAQARRDLDRDVRFHQFVQFQFRRQWTELKRYANERAVEIIGDIPIFVAEDSSDTWANQGLFRFDAEGNPTVVAGVPPDYFSPTGQLWGNPHYDWAALRETGYAWWIERVRAILAQVDIIRIDHFRAFAAAWVIPAGSETARPGRWERGPGAAVFAAIRNALGDVRFVAEDLGIITDDVVALRRDLDIPGMKVLQFAFGDDSDNAYLPHNYERDCVAYTATHDNQTTVGWFASRPEAERQAIQRYLGGEGSDISWELSRVALASVADTVILPLQDVMRLGDEARMNTPGQLGGNWAWRYQEHQLHGGLAEGLAEMTAVYGRRPSDPEPAGYDPFDYTAPDTDHPLHG